MLLGTPVVAFAVGGSCPTDRGREHCGSAGKSKHSLKRWLGLLADEDARRRLGAAAQTRVKSLYSTRAFVTALSELVAIRS